MLGRCIWIGTTKCCYFRISSQNGFHSVFTSNYDKLDHGKSRTKGLIGVIAAVKMLIFKWYRIYVWHYWNAPNQFYWPSKTPTNFIRPYIAIVLDHPELCSKNIKWFDILYFLKHLQTFCLDTFYRHIRRQEIRWTALITFRTFSAVDETWICCKNYNFRIWNIN